MKTTIKQHRYEEVMAAKVTTRDKILKSANITELEYFNAEFDTGCQLLDEYFKEMDAGLVYHISTMLLKDRKHGYWLWLINQKQQWEFAFHKEYTAVMGNDYNTVEYREEYMHTLAAFANSDKVHERLRQFIIQSKTISA